MSAKTRIYHVTDKDGKVSLIRATNRSQAVRHAAKNFVCRAATADDVESAMLAGIVPEIAGETPEDEETEEGGES